MHDYYQREVHISAEKVVALEPTLIERFDLLTGYRQREADRQRKVVDEILAQRRKLVKDHVARPGVIPLDVLEEQQAELEDSLKLQGSNSLSSRLTWVRRMKDLLWRGGGSRMRRPPTRR